MKRAMNFRFSPEVITTLKNLKKKLHISNTAILEDAILNYAKNVTQQQPLLKHMAVLSDKDAREIHEIISTTKHNKKKMVKL